jgi:hypothetical protein
MTGPDTLLPGDDITAVIPDPKIAKIVNKHLKTLLRWDRSARMRALGWPPVIKINGRNHRDAAAFRQFLRNVTLAALEA